ncbi:MAG: hypothetical protein J0I17_11335 ['Candidatus Kapabacteria' thiocyanatum]|uniref:Uncharacterized protein n=1 Tax=Candidatus Kapaibacterium thiocyanatum TaxID=1895771 RepID=A0A1M3KYR6_9BACT|nr:hypothetical protein ['Candidatus Kapabacteria' thiocyanatum]OJX57658.1 MAG: hypothetical protein BGO89_06715 ['Candidatus Kapabacteria' thiocyanatum]
MLILTVLAERHACILEENPNIHTTRRWNEWTEYSLTLTDDQASGICDAVGTTAYDSDGDPVPHRILFGVNICRHGRTIEFGHLESYVPDAGWVPVDVPDSVHDTLEDHVLRFLHEMPPAAELLAIDHVLLRHHLAAQTALVNN